MSIAAYCTAARNYLRDNIQNFYGGDAVATERNCKITYNEQPTPDCGQEFIAIYGDYHKPVGYFGQAIEEEFGIVIAVSRKIAVVPPDYRGELGYITVKDLPSTVGTAEADLWTAAWNSTETRCREIVKLLAGSDRYSIMQDANLILANSFTAGDEFTEPLQWTGTDAAPRPVGPEHFYSYADMPQDADPVFGLVMKVFFGKAIRLQKIENLDTTLP